MAPFTVYLARHGMAHGTHPQGDRARPLTPEGEAHVQSVMAAVREQVTLTRVVSSPYLRARRTAELWAGGFGVLLTVDDTLGSGNSSGTPLAALARRMEHGTLLVGHNPEMSEAVARLSGQGMGFPPGMVAALEFSADGKSTLLWTRV